MSNNSTPDYTAQIYWQNQAGLPDDQITAAFKALQSIYGPITLNARPFPTDQLPVDPYRTLVFTNNRIGPVQDAGGETLPGGSRGYVYPDSVSSYGNDQARALEFIIGHELGHMLGLKHVLNGIMNPRFTDHDLQQGGLQPLSQQQIGQIERTLDAMRKAVLLQRAKEGR